MNEGLGEIEDTTSEDNNLNFDQYDIKKNPNINKEIRSRYMVEQENAPEGLEIPRYVQELGQRLIAESPDNPDVSIAKLNSSYHLSRQLGIPLEQAYANFDEMTEEYYGRATPPQAAWEAIGNSYKAAELGTRISALAYKLGMGRGNDEEIYKQILALEEQMPPEDTIKRSLPITAMKMAAQFIPSQAKSFSAGAVEGGAFALGTAAIIAPPMALTGVGSLTVPAAAILAFGVGSAHGASTMAKELETGSLYYDLLRYKDPISGDRINPKVAWQWATIYGGMAAVVEMIEVDTFFKQFPGIRQAASAAISDVSAQASRSGVATRLLGNFVTVAKKEAKVRGSGIASEVIQETMQEALSIAGQEFAKQVTERMGHGTTMTPATAHEVIKRLTDTMVSTALGMGVLNIIPTMGNLFIPAAKTAAGIGKNSTMVGKEEILPGEKMTPEDLELFSRRMQEPLPADYQVQVSEVAAGEVYTLKMGTKGADPETGKATRYGWVRYELDRDEMAVKILGYEKGSAPNVNSALTHALMQRFPGWDMTGDAKSPNIAAMHQILTENNPRGEEAGLQWYKTPAQQDTKITYDYMKERIKEAKPGWEDKDIDFSVRFVDTWAKAMGTSGEKLADGIFAPGIIGERGGAVAAQGAYGAISEQWVDGQFKTMIQLTKNANPSTWMHEATHAAIFFALQNRDTDPAISRFLNELEGLIGVTDGDWNALSTGWTESYKGSRMHHEALAYAVEDYFLTGKVPDPKLKGMFHKIAKWLTDLYRSLTTVRYNISPELKAYFDNLFASPESPLYELGTTMSEEQARPTVQTSPIQSPGPAVATDTPESWNDAEELVDAATAPQRAPAEELEIYQGYEKAQDMEASGQPTDETGWSRSKYDKEWRYRSREQRQTDIDRTVQTVARAIDAPPAGQTAMPGYIKELYEAATLYQGREVSDVVYTFPEDLKGVSDVHSASQLPSIINTFGRGVVSADGQIVRIGTIGTSHAGISVGLTDARRFYYGYSKQNKAVYVVSKNSIDDTFLRKPEVLKFVLSQVFDKYKLSVAPGKKLTFRESIPSTLYQGENGMTLYQAENVTEEENKAFTSAIKTFGLTTDIYEAGYVLPGGAMIDFSGRHDAPGYTKTGKRYIATKRDYLKGDRNLDHREIRWEGAPTKGQNDSMNEFIRMGAVRIDADAGLADMSRIPTDKQWKVIKSIFDGSGAVWVEMVDGERKASIEGGNDKKALGYIRRFYGGENFEDTILYQGSGDSAMDRVQQTLEEQGIKSAAINSRRSLSKYISAEIDGKNHWIRVSDHYQGSKIASFDISITDKWEPSFRQWLGGMLGKEINTYEDRPREMKTTERGLLPAELFQIDNLYHGAKTGFELFDHSYMGTGEGQQVYGWGTYLTENKEVGRSQYAERLGEQFKIKYYMKTKPNSKAVWLSKILPEDKALVESYSLKWSEWDRADFQRVLKAGYLWDFWESKKTTDTENIGKKIYGYMGKQLSKLDSSDTIQDFYISIRDNVFNGDGTAARLLLETVGFGGFSRSIINNISSATIDEGYSRIFEQMKREIFSEGIGFKRDDAKAIKRVIEKSIDKAKEIAQYDADTYGGRYEDVNESVKLDAEKIMNQIDFAKTLEIVGGRWLYTVSVDTKGQSEAAGPTMLTGEMLKKLQADLSTTMGKGSMDPNEILAFGLEYFAEGELLKDPSITDIKTVIEIVKHAISIKNIPGISNEDVDAWADAGYGQEYLDGDTYSQERMRAHVLAVTMIAKGSLAQVMDSTKHTNNNNAVSSAAKIIKTYWDGPDLNPMLFLISNEYTQKTDMARDGRWLRWDMKISNESLNDIRALLSTTKRSLDTGSTNSSGNRPVNEIFGEDLMANTNFISKLSENLDSVEQLLTKIAALKKDTNKDTTGKMVYEGMAEYLTPKGTSLFLSAVGFDGTTFPVAFLTGGTGDKGMNYVVYNDKSMKVQRRVLFQGEGENAESDAAKAHTFSGLDDPSYAALKNEARSFDTWEEFASYVDTFFDEEVRHMAASDKMDETEKMRMYKEIWEAANQGETYGSDMVDWTKSLKTNDYQGLKDFLSGIWDEIISGETFNFQPDNLEESDTIAVLRERAERVTKEIAEVIKAGAIRIGAKEKELSPKFLSSIMGVINKNPEAYARIYGEIFDIPELVEAAKTAVAAKYADIDDPRIEAPKMTISQKAAIAEVLRNEVVGKKILRGDIVVDLEVKQYLEALKATDKADKKKIGELQIEIRDDNRLLGSWDRRWVDASKRISQADAELAKIDERINKLSNGKKKIPESLITEQKSITRIRSTMEAQRDRARRRVGNPARLQTTLAKIEQAASMKIASKDLDLKKRAAQKLQAYTTQLMRQIMKPPSDTINAAQAMAILDIQKLIDPHNRSKKTQSTIDALRFELENNPALAKEIGKEWLNRATKKNLREFTMAEIEEMASTVLALRSEGKAVYLAKKEARGEYFRTTQERIADLLMNFPGAANPGEKPDSDTFIGKLIGKVKDFDYAFTKSQQFARMLDGYENGPNYELMIFERDRAYRKEMEQIEKRTKRIEAAFAKEDVSPADWYKEEVTLKGAGPGKSDKIVRKSDIMALEMALRNEDSRQAAIFGNFFSHYEKRNMSEEDLYFEAADRFNVIRAAMDAVINETDMRILEAFTADGEETGRRIFETVAEVENRIMEIAEDYYPINREGVTGEPIDVQIAGDVLNRSPGLKRPPKNGFTKSRVNISPKGQTPIKLDLLTTWSKSIAAQEHYIANAAYGRRLDGVYLNNFMQEAIRAAVGDQGVAYVNEYIAEVKNPSSLENMSRWENSIKWLRGSLGAAYLGFRTSSMLKQYITSPWPALAYAGPTRFLSETFKCLANPVKYVIASEAISTVLRNRTADLVFHAVRTAKATTNAGRAVKKSNQVAMKGLELADRFSVAIGWRAMYEKEMADHGDTTIAIERADDMVLKTQPSSRGVDLAPIYRKGGETRKMLLQFTTPMNVIWNNIRHDLPAAIKDKHYARAIGIMTSYIISGVLLNLATEGDEGDDENRAQLLAFYTFTQGTESIPLIGQDVTRLLRTVITGESGYDFPDTALPGISQVFDGLTTVAKDADNWERGLAQFSSGVGLTVGAPVSGLKEVHRVSQGDFGALLGKPRRKE